MIKLWQFVIAMLQNKKYKNNGLMKKCKILGKAKIIRNRTMSDD